MNSDFDLDLDLNLQGALGVTRRQFLKHSQTGLGAIALAMLGGPRGGAVRIGSPKLNQRSHGRRRQPDRAHGRLMFPAKAKSVIYLHMSGAPPQQELFDYKPSSSN